MSAILPVMPENGPLEPDDPGYRDDYKSRYGQLGGSYDDYLPAYRLGQEWGADSRYAGRTWDESEADIETRWKENHPDSAWQDFKDAVRHAWEKVRS